jgi:hypothetical protein
MMKSLNSPRLLQKLTLHPLIHSFSTRKDTTICGGGSKRARVWIKVCYMKSHWNGRRVYIITLRRNYIPMQIFDPMSHFEYLYQVIGVLMKLFPVRLANRRSSTCQPLGASFSHSSCLEQLLLGS